MKTCTFTKFASVIILVSTLAITACGDGADKTGDGKGGGNKVDDSSRLNIKVIYGDDNRLDLYDVKDVRRLALADSTVGLFSSQDLKNVGGGVTQVSSVPFANAMGTALCPNERFRDQNVAAFCSGFLIAPDKIATAGHCITNDNDCASTKIAFGFSLPSSNSAAKTLPTSEVYSCAKILKREELMDGQDYGIIQLDRPVKNHAVLKLRTSGDPATSDQLMVIGHPSGLPTKVADGALIRFVRADYLRASLGTYGGNSGSAVFNTRTNEVEGILVRGEQDFVIQGGCLTSKKCGQNDCRGEDVTRISYALPFVK